MMTDVNWTYCGGHFTIYLSIESLYYTPEKKKKQQLLFNRKSRLWTQRVNPA